MFLIIGKISLGEIFFFYKSLKDNFACMCCLYFADNYLIIFILGIMRLRPAFVLCTNPTETTKRVTDLHLSYVDHGRDSKACHCPALVLSWPRPRQHSVSLTCTYLMLTTAETTKRVTALHLFYVNHGRDNKTCHCPALVLCWPRPRQRRVSLTCTCLMLTTVETTKRVSDLHLFYVDHGRDNKDSVCFPSSFAGKNEPAFPDTCSERAKRPMIEVYFFK